MSIRDISASFLLSRIVILCLFTPALQAQWTSQTLQLNPGWNAVFVEVQPEPRDCEAVFAGLPVESVWRWNRRFSPVQFISDSNQLSPDEPDWLVYLPQNHPLHEQSSLFTLDGCRAYLIKMPDGGAPVSWTILGKAILRKKEWISDSLNFVGFNLPTNNLPTFQSFFSGSPAHTNQVILRLDAQGAWQANAPTSVMRPGEAFWIRCKGNSDFQGPLGVALPQRTGLDYVRGVVEHSVKVKNEGLTSKTVQFRAIQSADVPAGGEIQLAGQVPLNYWKFDPAANDAGWTPLSSTLSRTLLPGQEWEVRLEVQRSLMANPPEGVESLYQSLLEVTASDNSTRLLIPVVAEGLSPSGLEAAVHPRAGLWVGSVDITHVNQPESQQPALLQPVAAAFHFKLIVHVDGVGQARLLQQVLQMWKPGTYETGEDGFDRVVEPGQFVLVTDPALASRFGGVALRDGEPVARRFSTAAFAFRDPILMNGDGDFGEAGAQRACDVLLDYDDPLNPFKHSYHPDHDNWDGRYSQKLGEGIESFSVVRSVRLEFSAEDPDRLASPGWGDTQLGGIYEETIEGLHRQPIHVQGTFRLHSGSRVSVLNPQ